MLVTGPDIVAVVDARFALIPVDVNLDGGTGWYALGGRTNSGQGRMWSRVRGPAVKSVGQC